uniref:Uncharacterized protein n=1 Tax=Anguilla anguilla TaxID=7936 RepID=A0A0E9SFJ0_ANGAN
MTEEYFQFQFQNCQTDHEHSPRYRYRCVRLHIKRQGIKTRLH